MSILKQRLDALGIKPRLLKSTKCPTCGESKINCMFSVNDGVFHIICSECNHQAEAESFDNAIYLFDAFQQLANSDTDECSLIENL